ncbi:MAG TPA: hypothetical protein VLA71_09995 [Algoriphagus sp.]|nr:hypothetical protein [Algoriphagus sp.]
MSKKSFFRSDKELDNLLRKISDSADIPFSEEDWGDMKARLDQLPRPAPAWWKNKIMVWVGAVLLGIMLSVALWNFLPITPEADQVAIELEPPKKETLANAGKSESTTNEGTEVTNAVVETKQLQAEGAKVSSEALSSATSVNQKSFEPTAISTEGLDSGLPGILTWDDSEEMPFPWQSNPIPPLDYSAPLPGSLVIPERNPNSNGMVEKENKSYGYAGRFSISVQAAPDLSGIKMNQVGKAGQAVGIGAAYFLNPKVSIVSGVFYSFKPYSTEGNTQYGSVNEPDRIFGECDILDIPINLRYYPVEGKLQRVFASVGLSSYLMLKEHYELEYEDNGSGYPYTREINVNGENNHFLGVVNISAGYERKLGKQLSIQVEPYFKVPISGVGEGDISLKSTGIFVSLNYYPGRK